MNAVVEHVTHAAAQRGIPVDVTEIDKTVILTVHDSVDRYALACIVTAGDVIRATYTDRTEELTGTSRLNPDYTVTLTGRM